jgi:hypothetical protein
VRRALLSLLVASTLTGAVVDAGATSPGDAGPGDQWCAGTYDTAPHRPARTLRFGVDPGVAGNPVPGGTVARVSERREDAALRGLRPSGRALVVRLNRLFWSGGEPLVQSFARRARALAAAGFDVEVQVRYHPASGDEGDIRAWARWVRHVVDVLGANRRLVSLTITNEVNLPISPNTSDGSYDRSQDALIRGIEAAHAELRRHGWADRVRLGFTFAYRFNPQRDVQFWQYLAEHGGARFRAALGFVGLDDYPGTFYPPVLVPGSPTGGAPGEALAEAAATMRRCYLPMGRIPTAVPIWVTENGYPTRTGASSEAEQRQALRDMVQALRSVGRTYGVTDYRWFNLRDNDSDGAGMFDTDGLLRDDYSRKPSYDAFRSLVRRYGTR